MLRYDQNHFHASFSRSRQKGIALLTAPFASTGTANILMVHGVLSAFLRLTFLHGDSPFPSISQAASTKQSARPTNYLQSDLNYDRPIGTPFDVGLTAATMEVAKPASDKVLS